MLETSLQGLMQVLQPETLMFMLIGIGIGFVVGILPGLGGPVALALMLPFAFTMEPVQAFAFLLGATVVVATAGDMTSVLIGVPGEATSASTVLDGYPMTRRGESGRALGAVLLSSGIGGIVGALLLALAIPVIRPLVLLFGAPEFFVLTLVGLTFVVALAGSNIVKGLIMAVFGLFIALVGVDSQDGVPRYTFDHLYLWEGIPLIPIVVGLFGGAELIQLMLSKKSIANSKDGKSGRVLSGVTQGFRNTVQHWRVVLQSGGIGAVVGMIPGLGGAVSQWVAYGYAKQTSKHPEEFGKGSIEGVIASGANNNAKDGSSLIPTVAFGIPGGANTAILLSGFLVVGLTPGTEMLTTNLDFTFSMVWIIVIANLIAICLALLAIRPLTRLTRVSGDKLAPILLLLLALGAYTTNNSFGDIFVMLAAAALGVMCLQWDWPRVPFLLAVVLGDLAERYLFLSYSLHGWSWVERPIVIVLFVVLVAALVIPYIRHRRARARRLREAAEEAK